MWLKTGGCGKSSVEKLLVVAVPVIKGKWLP